MQDLSPNVKVGVTTIVATTGAVVMLVAGKEAILLVPVAARPMLVLSLVQVYVVVPTEFVVVKSTAVVVAPLQSSWLEGGSTSPVGLTVMLKVFVEPTQELIPLVKVGVTTKLAVMGAEELFKAVKEMLPLPLAARLMAVLSLVQVYVVVPPELTVPKVTVAVVLLQTTWSAGLFTCPVGFTVMVKVLAGPAHEMPLSVRVGVTTIVAMTGAFEMFVAGNAGISVVPLAARPILVLSFVQA